MIVAILVPNRQAAAQSPTAAPAAGNASLDSPRILSLHEGKFSIDLSRYPVSGSVSAKHVVVIISDYTCPHCRDTEKTFIDALDGFNPGDVALVHLPGTREKKDGPSIHKIMLSLWQEHPAIYRRLSQQMIYEELPAEPQKVRAAAATAVGGPAILDALLEKHNAWAETQIEQTLQLMAANAASPAQLRLPQVMIGSKLITGAILNPAELQNYIHEQFAVAPVHLVYAVKQVPSNPDDPCEPSRRKSCGRLVISMIGAGEVRNDANQSDDSTVAGDKHAGDASSHLLQFTADSSAKLPSKHIVFTSDPEIKAWLLTLPFNAKVSLVGVVDASLPAFQRMVSPDAANSPLNKALRFFEADKGCKKLMNGSPSILPYLKVDIIIDTEGAESSKPGYYGVPVWKNEDTIGTLEKWGRDGTVLGKEEVSLLMRRLSGSLTHVFVKSCKAALIGNIFDSAIDDAGGCGCVLSVSDETQDHFSGGKLSRPAFNNAMDDRGYQFTHIRKSESFGKWAKNKASLASVVPALLDHQEPLIMNPFDPNGDSSALHSISVRRNPLFGFGHTSADAFTGKLLALLWENSSSAPAARAIAEAEFTSEIKQSRVPQYTGHEPFTRLDTDMARIKERLDDAKNQLGSMIDHVPLAELDHSVYTMGIEKFNACLVNKEPAPSACSVVKAMFDAIKEKETSGIALSAEEILFRKRYNKFTDVLKEIGFRTVWPRYIEGEVDLNDFLTKMSDAKRAFLEFKKGLEPLYTGEPGRPLNAGEKENGEKKRDAFTYLNDSFESAFNSAKAQVFDQLKKESTTTKLLRTEAAVDLLAANIDSIESRSEVEKLIARLASKLNCLTRYKIGPAHDQQPPGPNIPYQATK